MDFAQRKFNIVLYLSLVGSILTLFSLKTILNEDIMFTVIFFIGALIAVYYYAYHFIPITLMYFLCLTTMIKGYLTFLLYKTKNPILPDSIEYIRLAKNMQHINLFSFSEMVNFSGTTHIAYYSLIGFVYSFFQNEYALYTVNILFFNMTIVLLYKILKYDFDKKISFYTCLLLILSANSLLFTSLVLKDSLVLFLTVLSIYIYKFKIEQKNKYKVLNVLILFTILITLLMTRIYTGASIFLAIFIDLLFIKEIKYKWIVLCVVLFFLSSFLFSNVGSTYTNLIMNYLNSFDIISVIPVTLLAIIKFFVAPLPWNFFNEDLSIYTLLLLDSSFILLCLFFIVPFLFSFIKRGQVHFKKYVLYLVPIIIHAVALGFTYNGDSARQRIAVYWIVILITVISIFYFTKKRSRFENK